METMDESSLASHVKREAADVKTENVEYNESTEQVEHVDESDVHTVVLQNIEIEEVNEIPVEILNEYDESNSDGNLQIDTEEENVIHTYIIDNSDFEQLEGQEIVFEEDDDDDGEETIHYVIEENPDYEENSDFDQAQMEYIYNDDSEDAAEEPRLAEDAMEEEELVEMEGEEEEEDPEEMKDERKDEIVRLEDIKKEEDLVECDICSKVFKTTAGLKRHITVNHGVDGRDEDDPLTLQLCPCCGEPSDSGHSMGDYKCDKCDKLFQQENFLVRHSCIEHPTGNAWVCCECKKKFGVKEEMVDHMRIHPVKTVKCLGCNREFTRKYHLDRHVGQTGCMGAPKKAYDCRVCNKFFTRKDNLAEHLRAHAGQVKKKRKYVCEYCNKEFQGLTLMSIHVRTHTGERPYLCDLCPKKFPSSGAMKKHRRMHTGEKPYQCEQCDRTFAAKETLNRHWRTHTGEKPHVCQFCGKAFIQPSQLRAHIFHHTGENAYTCAHCGRAFNRRLRLTTHIKFMHEGAEPLPCPRCDKTFFRKEDVARHLLSHTGERPFSCEICGKGFAVKSSLKIHMLTHRKEPPCSCETCGRAFIRKDCLMRHIRARHRDVLEDIMATAEKKRLQQQLLKAATDAASKSTLTDSIVWNELTLTESIKELLTLLVDEDCLLDFGYPDAPVDRVLDSVIRKCGHKPASEEDFDYLGKIRENAKLLFTVVIDDDAVKELLNNQTVDEVIMHVLRLAKHQDE